MRIRLRASKDVFAHCSWAARARSIAARTSSGPHFGTVPSGFPVNGCSICIGSLPAGDTTPAASASSCAGVIRFEGRSIAGGALVSAVMVDMAPILPGHSQGAPPLRLGAGPMLARMERIAVPSRPAIRLRSTARPRPELLGLLVLAAVLNLWALDQ